MPDRGTKILYVEDDTASVALVRKLLEFEGFQVLSAGDGIAGLQLARREPPDLVLMDIGLPRMEGEDVALRIKSVPGLEDVPIVAVTAGGGVEDEQSFLALGCEGFIGKPLDPESFADTVRSYLEGRKDSIDAATAFPLLKEYTRGLSARLEGKIQELTEANERLVEFGNLKSRFIQNVTHELSAPLTPILGYARILRMEQAGTLNDVQRRCLTALQVSAERLKRMVDSLLEVTNLESGRFVLERESLPARDLLAEVVANLAEQISEAGVEVRIDAGDSLKVFADRRKLVSALGHVLHNALKVSPRGASVLLAAVRQGKGTCLAVFDGGPGIAAEQLDEIFEDFSQIEFEPGGRTGGAGLGLSITRRIVEAHGGQVWAESPPRMRPTDGESYEGSCVALLLPPS